MRTGLLDPKFKYTKAADTDIAKTFARIRRQMKEAAKAPPPNVKQLKKKETK